MMMSIVIMLYGFWIVIFFLFSHVHWNDIFVMHVLLLLMYVHSEKSFMIVNLLSFYFFILKFNLFEFDFYKRWKIFTMLIFYFEMIIEWNLYENLYAFVVDVLNWEFLPTNNWVFLDYHYTLYTYNS